MPDYKFTDPSTGLTLKVSGPTPPTEAVLRSLFADAAKKGAQPPAAVESAPSEPSLNETSIGPEDDNRPVTLGDLIDDPKAALGRMVTLTKNTLHDPKVMIPLALGAAYGAYRGSGIGTGRVPAEGAPMAPTAPVTPKASIGQAIRQNVKLDDVVEAIPGARNAQAAYRVVRGVQRALGRNEPAPAEVPPASVPTAAAPPTPPVEAPAAPPRESVTAPKPKAARVAKAKAETTPDATGDLPSLDELHLTPAEISTAVKWHENGVSPETILHRILQSRQLTARTRTETPDQAAAAVRYRNEHGRWQSEK